MFEWFRKRLELLKLRWELFNLQLTYISREPYDVEANHKLADKINEKYYALKDMS